MVVPVSNQIPLEQVGKGDQAQPQHKMVGDYTLVATLGSGSFATVYKAIREGKETVAIKAIARNSAKITKKVLENLELEISILKKHQHPNIVSLTQVDKTESHVYLFLEYCAGGDLQRLIRTRKSGRLSEGLTRRLMRDLTAGLSFLGKQQLIHRDIKPQNLLLTGALPLDEINDPCKTHAESINRRSANFPSDQFHLKIADFGFARHLQKTSMADTLCGSPLYMAPEILQHQRYDNKADLWSVGTVLFEMITGRPPFHGENHIDLLHNIQRKAVRLPPDLKISNECIDLLRILLNRSPKKRAGLKEFIKKSEAFVNLGCNGTLAASEVLDSMNMKIESKLDDIPEDDDSPLRGSAVMGLGQCSDVHLKENERKDSNSEVPCLKSAIALQGGSQNSPLIGESLPPLLPSPPGPKSLAWPNKQLISRSKQDPSSTSEDSEFVIVPDPSPLNPKRELLMNEYHPVNLIPPVLQKFRKKQSILSTSPNAARNIIFPRYLDEKPQLNRHFGSSRLETLIRTLNTSDDVGRRAINVAKVGDSRAYLGIKKSEIAIEDSSLKSMSTPMEGVEQVRECSSLGSSSSPSLCVLRTRTVSDAEEESVSRRSGCEVDECDDDDMPFAMTTPSDDSVIPLSPTKEKSPTVDQPPHDSVVYFQEALMCYIKALSMLKSSVNTSQNVFLELSHLHENASVDSQHLTQLKAHCERSRMWLSSQFKAVLERADAANVEVTKDEGYVGKKSGTSGAISRQADLFPINKVDELIYNHSLACGREGAVKQLLGHNDAARSCYRSAGLLAETLLLNPNIGFQDKAILEDYVQGFLDRINELDSSTMIQQSRHSIDSGNANVVSGIISASVMRKGSNELSTQGQQM